MEDQKLSSEQEDVKMAGESVSRQAEKGNGPEREDAYLALLLKMAMRRKHTPHPDVDEEWTRFMARHSNNPKVFRMRKMNPWVAALLGAAAMWCAVILYDSVGSDFLNNLFDTPVVAINYETYPQRVILNRGDNVIDISKMDSLSFVSKQGKLQNDTVSQLVGGSKVLEPAQKLQAIRQCKLSTPRGMGFKVILPDGSEVLLNAESTIEFPEAFHHGVRRVTLHGEAFFKVAHDENMPFIVTADQMVIRVHGTEFNLRNYDDDECSCVSLIRGSVEVSSTNNNGESVMIEPGEKAWVEGNKLQVAEEDTYVVTQWTHGLFYFDGTPLVDVLRELGRWYNFKVIFYNKEAMNYTLHFSASREETIDEAISHLNRLRKFRVEKEGQTIIVR